MQKDDLPAALALWRATEGMGLGDSDRPERLAAFLDRNPGASAVALDVNGALIGAVLCGDDGRRGYLHHLAVARDWRRRGVAKALLAHCFAVLKRREIEKCNIFLLADNTDGERFWQQAGWVCRGDLKVLQRNVAAGAAVSGSSC
jgi:putative acetyltransferase